jgi:hypothetical protein
MASVHAFVARVRLSLQYGLEGHPRDSACNILPPSVRLKGAIGWIAVYLTVDRSRSEIEENLLTRIPLLSFTGLLCITLVAGASSLSAQAPAAGAAKAVGTVKAASGKNITLAAEGGSEITVVVQDGARLLRIEPGQTDLKTAAPLQLEDLQSGDRLLVRGTTGPDGKSLLAVSVIAMKKADLAEKRAHERDEWQKHGVGGLVSAVDPAAGMVTISTSALGANKSVEVHISKDTVLRRYAPGSAKFDDATPAPIDQINVGDQLRARGARTADGGQVTADEVISGSFRNISGTIGSIDAGAGTITVSDLLTKKPVLVKVNDSSQLRKLPPAMAQRIAARLKGAPAEGQPTGSSGGASQGASPQAGAALAGEKPAGGQRQGGPGGGGQSGGGQSTGGQGGSSDLQQAIGRMPAAKLADLQKGDAVMIVATPGSQDESVVAITLLAGVEPILQASGGQSILTPWSLSGSPGGDAGPQ